MVVSELFQELKIIIKVAPLGNTFNRINEPGGDGVYFFQKFGPFVIIQTQNYLLVSLSELVYRERKFEIFFFQGEFIKQPMRITVKRTNHISFPLSFSFF